MKFSEIFKQLKSILKLDTLIDVFKRPELHAREIPFVLGTVSIVMLIIIAYFYVFFYRRVKIERKPDEVRKKSGFLAIAFLIAATASFYVPGAYFTSKRSCLQCHQQKGNHSFVMEQYHLSIDCRECHLKPGTTGRLEGLFQLTSKVLSLNVTGMESDSFRLNASPANCVRCHRNVLYETVISNYIRISHREIYTELKDCLVCHHFQIEKRRFVELEKMGRCRNCHDGKKAKSDCSFCHTIGGEPSKIRPDLSDYPKVTIKGEAPVKTGEEPSPAVNIKDF